MFPISRIQRRSSVSYSAAAQGITLIIQSLSSTAVPDAAAIISGRIPELDSSLFSGIVALVAFLTSPTQIRVDGFPSRWVWNNGIVDGELYLLLCYDKSGFDRNAGDWTWGVDLRMAGRGSYSRGVDSH